MNTDHTFDLAQGITCLDRGAHSTKPVDRHFEALVGLGELDFLQRCDLDALGGALLLEQCVQPGDFRRLLAGQLEIADAGGVEDQLLDALLVFQDRTDPGGR